jgi:hypothetical protein
MEEDPGPKLVDYTELVLAHARTRDLDMFPARCQPMTVSGADLGPSPHHPPESATLANTSRSRARASATSPRSSAAIAPATRALTL